VLLQADKLKVTVIQQLKSDTSLCTPDTVKDAVTKKASLSQSKSMTRSSAKSTPQLITPKMSDNKVLLKIYYMFVLLSCAMCNGFILHLQNILYMADNDNNNLACLVLILFTWFNTHWTDQHVHLCQ